jgi:hypothetical protein
MKTIMMTLILSVIASPLQANQHGNQYADPSACLKTYDHYLQGFGIGRDEMMNFLNNCMPVNPAINDEPQQRKLLQIVDDNKRIITVRT